MRTRKTTGSTVTEYFQDVAGGLPRVAADKTDTVWNYYVYGNGLIGKVGSDNVARYYHYDGTGHVRAITDSTGAVVERYDYDAFGTLRNTPIGLSNDRRFTGEQFDAETAYTFLRARYYDPALGRFISKDPFDGVKKDPQTLNGYIYVGNNPVNLTDPSGKCPCFAAMIGWAAANPLAAGAIGGYLATQLLAWEYGDELADLAEAAWEGLSTLWAERNPAQDHQLTPGEIEKLKDAGVDIHDLKGGDNASERDLYKDRQGNIYVKPKGGRGPGDETGFNINDY